MAVLGRETERCVSWQSKDYCVTLHSVSLPPGRSGGSTPLNYCTNSGLVRPLEQLVILPPAVMGGSFLTLLLIVEIYSFDKKVPFVYFVCHMLLFKVL